MPTRKPPRSPLTIRPDGQPHTLDLAAPIPDGADPALWRGRMRLIAQERTMLAAYFATPDDSDPEAQRLLRQLDALDAAIADNARMQHVPVHRMPRLMRPEREAGARPVFGKGKVAA